MPGYFGNGPGLGGIYYDNISGTFRSTAPGNNEVTWQYAYSVAENYASERWWRQDAYVTSGSEKVYKGSIMRHSYSSTTKDPNDWNWIERINTNLGNIASTTFLTVEGITHRFRPIVNVRWGQMYGGSSLYTSLNSIRNISGVIGNTTFIVGTGFNSVRYFTDNTYSTLEFSSDMTFGIIGAYGSKILPYFGVGVRVAGPVGFLLSTGYFGTKETINQYQNLSSEQDYPSRYMPCKF